jgi:hypothetical protein
MGAPIHGPFGPVFYPIDKANIIADCLENRFRVQDLCDCDMWRLKSKPRWLPPMKTHFLIYDSVTSQKIYRPWNQVRPVVFYGIQDECLQLLPIKSFFAFNTFIQSQPSAWWLSGVLEGSRKYNSVEIWQKTQNFPKTYVQSASCPLRANYLRSWF